MKDILTFPVVSIAIVNLNGKDYLKECLESLKNLNYPQEKIETIIIDNGSKDGSVDFIKARYPDLRLIVNNKNIGFAYANNQAAREAHGEYIAFLNNDTVVDREWLIELLKPIYDDIEVVASGSKVLSADGKTLDFIGSMINFEGKGFQIDYGIPVSEDIYKEYRFLPFANGGAMLINRSVFIEAGGFDEDFFAYYEDVDLGWRLWVLGYKIIFSPKSIVYHHHHGTSKIFSEDRLRFLKERNSLYSVFKNYDDQNLPRLLSAALANIYNRIFVDFKFDYKNYYDLSSEDKIKVSDAGFNIQGIDKEPLSSLMSVKDFFDNLPRLIEKREEIQRKRKRDDKAIFSYFKGEFLAVSADKDYQENQINLLKSLGIYDVFERRIKRKLLIISHEVVSGNMAGPAIRVWNFAKVLSQHIDVTLAIPNKVQLTPENFKVVQFKDDKSLREIIKDADILLAGGLTVYIFASVRESRKYLIIDIYDPFILATLAEYKNEPMKKQVEIHKSIHLMFNNQLYYGDFFICASERQRDFWLGMLTALNRVNPYSYNEDTTLRKLIEVVPFGLPTNKPMHTREVLKGKIDGIGKDDFVIIWGGGIYNWFDPLTLIRAMKIVSEKRQDIKLFFMGVKHPNPEIKELQLVNDTVNLAKILEVYDKNVFFNFGWVEYDDRQNYLLEADAGIITHPMHVETRFSFRTRILDYLWAELPIITSEGDHLSDMVDRKKLGIVTREGDEKSVAEAILKIAEDKDFYSECKKNISNISGQFTWEKVCAPLVKFCQDPIPSAYKKRDIPGISKADNFGNIEESEEIGGANNWSGGKLHGNNKAKKNKISYLAGRFFYHLFNNGPRMTSKFVSNYLKGR